MKISYYAYYIEDIEKGVCYKFQLNRLLSNVVKLPLSYKNTFKHNEDFVFLTPDTFDSNSYCLFITREQELISIIDKKRPISIEDVNDRLEKNNIKDESIGALSFLYLGSSPVFAMAGKLQSPRFFILVEFINQYLALKGFKDRYVFHAQQLMISTSMADFIKKSK